MGDYSMSVDVIGFKELQNALAEIGGVAETELKGALDKSALKVERRAKENAPHKQGALRGSIHREPAYSTGNNIEARVGTDIAYGRAQEYGTVGMTIHSHSKRGTQFTYIGNIKPKEYMKDAKQDSLSDMDRYLNKALDSIVEHLAKG